jgi:hypothetical protein
MAIPRTRFATILRCAPLEVREIGASTSATRIDEVGIHKCKPSATVYQFRF